MRWKELAAANRVGMYATKHPRIHDACLNPEGNPRNGKEGEGRAMVVVRGKKRGVT